MNKSLALLTVTLLLGGCQSLIHKTPDGTPPVEDTAVETKAKPEKYGSFSEDSLYSLLVAELAGQRNRFDIALSNYVVQAQKTRDPGVSERAFRIAEYLGADQEALDTSLLWARSAPDNLDAQRAAAIQLARAGRYEESMVYMEKVLNGQGDTHFDFLALSAAETDPDTRAGLLQSFDHLLKKYPNNGQLLFGKALLLQQDGRPDEALTLLEDNSASRHEVAPAAPLAPVAEHEAQRRGPAAAQGRDQGTPGRQTRAPRLRAPAGGAESPGRRQGRVRRTGPAIPRRRRPAFLPGAGLPGSPAWDEARIYLEELVERDSHVDAAHFNLGRLAEEQKDTARALDEYAQVGPGNDFLPAQLRQTDVLLKAGRVDEAAQRLDKARSEQPDYAIQLYLIEAEALSNNDQQEKAWQAIQEGLKQYPEDLNLLYTRSMLAEKRNDLAQMEKDLRFVIAREPDNAMALNALGYTLADRTTRYGEARELILKAHKLNPDDPAILDSMGWINYRQGKLADAERYLRQALQRYPDHEVAAHLGEALWAQGRQGDARAIWREYLDKQPDSDVLRRTIKRLTGTETP